MGKLELIPPHALVS